MAIIIETCPKCGHDLADIELATYPSISKKQCFHCGWSSTGGQEEIIRTPYNNNINNFEQPACIKCSNNPKNGGSGWCNCILGSFKITY